jgi:uncharacterized protein (TIGR03083 family)
MLDPFAPLTASVLHLRDLVGSLPPEQLTSSAYPTEWTIADVLSHLGSGAVIFQLRSESTLRGETLADDFATTVWDEWNAKDPRAQAADALAADQAVLDHLDGVTDDQRAQYMVSLGPLSVDFATYVGLRLNEHALHTWDIEVARQPAATLAPDATAAMIDNLEMIARYTAKPTGTSDIVRIHTVDPDRHFAISLAPDAATFAPSDDATSDADVELPAEALIRLVYGRLDADHTPTTITGSNRLDDLRQVFPGP